MKEKCIDCHWFDKFYDDAEEGTCRVESPAIGQPEVQQDGRCGKFRLTPSAVGKTLGILLADDPDADPFYEWPQPN